MLSDHIINVFNERSRSDYRTSLYDIRFVTKQDISALAMQILSKLKSKIAPYKIFKLRKRYFLTKKNTVRIRYVAPAAILSILGVSLYGSPNASVLSFEDAPYSHNQTVSAQENENLIKQARSVLPDNLINLVRLADPSDKEDREDLEKSFAIESGQTIAGILQDAGLSGRDAYNIVKVLGEHIDVRKIRAGETFDVTFQSEKKIQDEKEYLVLANLSMEMDALKTVNITPDDESFAAEIAEKEVIKRTYAGSTQIQTSLYGSAARSGIPSQVIAKMIRMYSWSVDFQRDIRRDDRIEVLYDVYETKDGDPVKYGDVLYANLNVGGNDLHLYRYEKSDGHVDYYDSKGLSTKKTLMKTPVDGARISSGFGMRRHPVLGYNKMHKGMDFAASLGTPIYAAGDGVLERVGRNGGYGNYIRIRHNSTLKTAYAHMHKFAKGMSKGKRVKQGELIGYVGSTGRSTGPHLHYEVLLNGKQVNPNRVDLPVGEALKGNDKDRFKAIVKEYDQKYIVKSRSQGLASVQNNSKEEKAG